MATTALEDLFTSPGTALGTVALHVAEQARGEETGHPHRPVFVRRGSLRDATGVSPFHGNTSGPARGLGQWGITIAR